jgi:hypothetical protein
MQLCTLEFKTDKFPPILPEPCQVNADLYGFELAVWLAQALAQQGVISSYPMPDEWGWFLEFISEHEQELMVGCASVGASQGYPTDWRVFVRQRRRPRKGGEDLSPLLIETILSVLAAEGIDAVKSSA